MEAAAVSKFQLCLLPLPDASFGGSFGAEARDGVGAMHHCQGGLYGWGVCGLAVCGDALEVELELRKRFAGFPGVAGGFEGRGASVVR